MHLFSCSDYKQYVRLRIQSLPKKGHGQYRRLATHLGIHTTLISQIFKGDRHLTSEQAALAADFLGLTEIETEMFLALVALARAGNPKLVNIIKIRIDKLRRQAQKLSERLPQDVELTEEMKAMFYGRWYYSAIRLATDLPHVNSVEEIARILELRPSLVARVVDFLLAHGMCISTSDGLQVGPLSTHLSSDSPFVSQHHTNWRLKSLERIEKITDRELLFTAPLTLSRTDFDRVREILLEMIDKIYGIVKASPAEKLSCLNIDWINISNLRGN